jgi:hypothetical protein
VRPIDRRPSNVLLYWYPSSPYHTTAILEL